MFFGGGFPFGFQSGHHEEDDQGEEQQQQNYFDLLDCRPDAPIQQITQKYEALIAKHGPQGEEPNLQLVEQLNEAYEVLSNPQKRKIYEMSQGNQGGNIDYIQGLFNMMFNQQGKKQKKGPNKPKMQPTKRAIEVTLNKIYTGGVVDLHHQRARLCSTCDGKGGQNVKKCPVCEGQGGVVQLVQVGPGMYSQMQKDCENCNAMGQLFDEGIKCKICDGRKIIKTEVNLPITIPLGIPAGEIIKLQGEGNEVPSASAGDLLLVVQQTPHQYFTRKGADLYYKKNITLIEALIGFNFKLLHLDGKQHIIYTKTGEVVGDQDKKIVKGLGMPFYKNQQQKGNLIIQFKVIMPKRGQITSQQLQILSQVLPGQINQRPKDTNYQMLQDFDKQHLNSSQQGGKKKQDDDEDDGQEGIGCQAQ